jgi:hypothetical protein
MPIRDANADGEVDIADALTVLFHLFAGSPAALECEDAADIDDSGVLDIADAIRLLGFLFLGGPVPPEPYRDCGADPTGDLLGCSDFPPCSSGFPPCSQKPGPLDPPALEPFVIDWPSYLNWRVGRAWRFQTTASEETYSQYVKETTTKNGREVYVVGWSSNWSYQLDYWYFDSDGVYLMGFYDENLRRDVAICPPYWIPNVVELGTEYTQEVQRGDEIVTAKTTFELVNVPVTVPYGTFDDVIKVTFKTHRH